jgi:hypothetical protein
MTAQGGGAAPVGSKVLMLSLHVFEDPTDELPWSEVDLVVSASHLVLLEPGEDGDEPEELLQWAWPSVCSMDAVAGDDGDMDLLEITAKEGMDFAQHFVFQCNDGAYALRVLEEARAEHVEKYRSGLALNAPSEHDVNQGTGAYSVKVSAEERAVRRAAAAALKLRSQSRRTTLSFAVLIGYFASSWLFFSKILGETRPGPAGPVSWSFVDAAYFGIVTATTVGYGDISPQNPGARLFACFFAVIGVGAIGVALGHVSTFLHMKHEQLRRMVQHAALEATKLALNTAGDTVMQTGKAVTSKKQHSNWSWSKTRYKLVKRTKLVRKLFGMTRAQGHVAAKLAAAFIPLIGFIILGSVVGRALEEEQWSWIDSIYWATISMCTVGYGDIAPYAHNSRLFCIFFIPLSVVALVSCIGTVTHLVVKEEKREVGDVKGILRHGCSVNKFPDGKISKARFVIFMLEQMELCNLKDLEHTRGQFQKLDHDGNGTIVLAHPEDISRNTPIHKNPAGLVNMVAGAAYDTVSKIDGQLHDSVQLGQRTGGSSAPLSLEFGVRGGAKNEAHISV